jgi:hypothetical protein
MILQYTVTRPLSILSKSRPNGYSLCPDEKPNMNLSPDGRSSFVQAEHKTCQRPSTTLPYTTLTTIVFWNDIAHVSSVIHRSCLPPSHPPNQVEPPPVTPSPCDHHLQHLLRTSSSATQNTTGSNADRQTWLCNIYAEHGTMENFHGKDKGNSEHGHGVRPDAKMREMWCGLLLVYCSVLGQPFEFLLQVNTFLALRKSSSDRMGGMSIRSRFIVPVTAAKTI